MPRCCDSSEGAVACCASIPDEPTRTLKLCFSLPYVMLCSMSQPRTRTGRQLSRGGNYSNAGMFLNSRNSPEAPVVIGPGLTGNDCHLRRVLARKSNGLPLADRIVRRRCRRALLIQVTSRAMTRLLAIGLDDEDRVEGPAARTLSTSDKAASRHHEPPGWRRRWEITRLASGEKSNQVRKAAAACSTNIPRPSLVAAAPWASAQRLKTVVPAA